MTLRRCGTAALVVLTLATLAGAAGPPRIAAHRGGALLWPENSLLAYRHALAAGVDLVETDVHLTRDGEVVVLHDPTLDRTTTMRGAVRTVSRAELDAARLRGLDGTPTDERVPALAALLDLVAPTTADILLEIKVDAGRQRYPGIEEKVLALLSDKRLLARTFLMAFQPDTIRRMKELDRSVRTVLLVSRGQLERQGARGRDAVRAAAEAGAALLGIQHTALDADVIAAARGAGILVAAWTVNEDPDIARVVSLGVDIVISDRPDLVRQALSARR
jgi:glycerophosphoryl diester phosphodiesterase